MVDSLLPRGRHASQDWLLIRVPVCVTRAEVRTHHCRYQIKKDTMALILATQAHSSGITCSGGSHLSRLEQHCAEVHVVKNRNPLPIAM